jgi:hypothetical protein
MLMEVAPTTSQVSVSVSPYTTCAAAAPNERMVGPVPVLPEPALPEPPDEPALPDVLEPDVEAALDEWVPEEPVLDAPVLDAPVLDMPVLDAPVLDAPVLEAAVPCVPDELEPVRAGPPSTRWKHAPMLRLHAASASQSASE